MLSPALASIDFTPLPCGIKALTSLKGKIGSPGAPYDGMSEIMTESKDGPLVIVGAEISNVNCISSFFTANVGVITKQKDAKSVKTSTNDTNFLYSIFPSPLYISFIIFWFLDKYFVAVGECFQFSHGEINVMVRNRVIEDFSVNGAGYTLWALRAVSVSNVLA
jgi:hypothetical protein